MNSTTPLAPLAPRIAPINHNALDFFDIESTVARLCKNINTFKFFEARLNTEWSGSIEELWYSIYLIGREAYIFTQNIEQMKGDARIYTPTWQSYPTAESIKHALMCTEYEVLLHQHIERVLNNIDNYRCAPNPEDKRAKFSMLHSMLNSVGNLFLCVQAIMKRGGWIA